MDFVDPRTGELIEGDTVHGLARVAELHQEALNELAARADEAAASEVTRPRPSAWNWRAQTPHSAERLWHDLADWVGWLRGRYPLAHQIPTCWWRHPELVEELTALWVCWRDAFEDPKAPMTAPIDWHDRWLPSLLRRLGTGGWNIACTDEHRARVDSAYDETAVDDPAAFQQHIHDTAALATPRPAGGETLPDHDIDGAHDRSEARLLGSLPGAPAYYADRYWLREDDGHWMAIEDEETIAYLEDADRRLALADAAVDRTQP